MLPEAAGASRAPEPTQRSAATPGPPPYPYDVFISYSHQDTAWVRSELVPFLDGAGLRVFIDFRECRYGELLRECLERAVRDSRHTVVVLTPDWLSSDWARYEELLASSDDPLRRKRRVVPLLLKDCRPSGGLALLLYADLIDPDLRPMRMKELLGSLVADGSGSLPTPTLTSVEPPPVRGEPVGSGLEALCKLMQRPQVRDAVITFRIHFEEACRQIDVLGTYKDQHDLLHRLQNECYDHVSLEVQRFPADERARIYLEDGELTLQEILQELRTVAARGTLAPNETAWIETDLASAHQNLRTALDSSDAEQLRQALWWLNRVLNLQPSRINTLLNGAAKSLRLPYLVQTLRTLCDGLSGPGLDANHVKQFEHGVAALAELNQSLACLVRAHDRWQEVDLELRRIESSLLAQHPEELKYSWPAVSPKLESLCKDAFEPWAADLEADRQQLTSALGAQIPGKTSSLFRSCRRRANFRFYQVDCSLKKQCDELRKAAGPLAAVLRTMV